MNLEEFRADMVRLVAALIPDIADDYRAYKPDSFFSVPACTRYRGKHVAGFFMTDDDGVKFCPMNKHKSRLGIAAPMEA